MRKLILLLLLLLSPAWAATEGPNSPTTQGTNSPAWTNPENMETQNDTDSDGDHGDIVNQETFAFTEPSGSDTIDGITVEVDWHRTGTRNNTLRLNLLNVGTCTEKEGAIGGTSDTDTYQTFGGATDTWSCTNLTAANVTAAAFGVHVEGDRDGGAPPLSGTYHVDHVRVTIDYTVSTPPSGALKIRTTRVTSNTATGTQDITISGIGTPAAAWIFAGMGKTDNTAADHARVSIGFTDGTRHRSSAITSDHNVADTATRTNSTTDTTLLVLEDGAGTDAWNATFDSFITDGIRINWGTVAGGGETVLVHAVFWVGGEGSEYYVGDFTLSSTQDATTGVTDPGFTPDMVFLIGASTGGDARFNWGVADNQTTDTDDSFAWFENDVEAAGNPVAQVDDRYSYMRLNNSSAVDIGEITSYDANGFTATQRGASAVGDTVNYFTVKLPTGVEHWAGNFSIIANTTGLEVVADPGFRPQFVGLVPNEMIQLQSFRASQAIAGVFALGFAHSTTDEYSLSVAIENAAATTNTQSLSDDKIGMMPIDDGSSGYDVQLDSFDALGFTLDVLAGPGAGERKWIGFAIGEHFIGNPAVGAEFMKVY